MYLTFIVEGARIVNLEKTSTDLVTTLVQNLELTKYYAIYMIQDSVLNILILDEDDKKWDEYVWNRMVYAGTDEPVTQEFKDLARKGSQNLIETAKEELPELFDLWQQMGVLKIKLTNIMDGYKEEEVLNELEEYMKDLDKYLIMPEGQS